MRLTAYWLSLSAALLLQGCDATSSTVVDAGARQVAPSRPSTNSQTCDATFTQVCAGAACCRSDESCVSTRQAAGDTGFFCGACPAEYPAACSQKNCCRSSTACIVNFPSWEVGECLCAVGETKCGELCCPAGSTCSDGVCRSCPASAPTLCGTECREGSCDDSVDPGGTGGGAGCSPSTGCGNGWLSSCDNRCYATSSDCQAAGPPQSCYSGSCRRCP